MTEPIRGHKNLENHKKMLAFESGYVLYLKRCITGVPLDRVMTTFGYHERL